MTNHTRSAPASAFTGFNWLDPQRLVFIGFFLFGSLGVITIKEMGAGPLVSIGFSAVVMLGYIVYCGSSKHALSAEILGDNIYYMGFLFTLVSLAYTLYKFTSADNEIDQIIKNFGIALTTTLIGVVGRVYFNQTRDESAEVSEPILRQRADQSDRLQEALAQVHNCQAALADQTQALAQGVSEASRSMQALIQSLGAVNQSAHAINNELLLQRQSYQAQIQSESTAFQAMNAQIQSDTMHSVAALDALQAGLDMLSRARSSDSR